MSMSAFQENVLDIIVSDIQTAIAEGATTPADLKAALMKTYATLAPRQVKITIKLDSDMAKLKQKIRDAQDKLKKS